MAFSHCSGKCRRPPPKRLATAPFGGMPKAFPRTSGRLYVRPLERYEVSWKWMAYSRLLSFRGDRREATDGDRRRSRPDVDRSRRPKGGVNDQLTYMSHFIRHIQHIAADMSVFIRDTIYTKSHQRGFLFLVSFSC